MTTGEWLLEVFLEWSIFLALGLIILALALNARKNRKDPSKSEDTDRDASP